jgi:acetyltransferase-like isoleucine patch superfamily enzyme
MKRKDIAIFGFKDSVVGQLINMLDIKIKKKLNCIISFKKIHNIKIREEHKKRPNKKTNFITDNKIFGLPVFYSKNFINILKKKKIKHVYVLEDKGIDRSVIFKKVEKEKLNILSFIHNSVKLMGDNSIGKGAIIFPDCYIGYKSDIGDGCFIQSGCRIEHHNSIGKFCDINPCLITGGFTQIRDFCQISIAVNIINKISIGNHSRVGAGSLVMKNIKNNELHYGVPAKFIKKLK